MIAWLEFGAFIRHGTHSVLAFASWRELATLYQVRKTSRNGPSEERLVGLEQDPSFTAETLCVRVTSKRH